MKRVVKRDSKFGRAPRYRRAQAVAPAPEVLESPRSSTDVPVVIFVDLSNLWVGLCRAGERMGEEFGLRFDFRQLMRLLVAGRPVRRAIAVADAELPTWIQQALRSAGFEVYASGCQATFSSLRDA